MENILVCYTIGSEKRFSCDVFPTAYCKYTVFIARILAYMYPFFSEYVIVIVFIIKIFNVA